MPNIVHAQDPPVEAGALEAVRRTAIFLSRVTCCPTSCFEIHSLSPVTDPTVVTGSNRCTGGSVPAKTSPKRLVKDLLSRASLYSRGSDLSH